MDSITLVGPSLVLPFTAWVVLRRLPQHTGVFVSPIYSVFPFMGTARDKCSFALCPYRAITIRGASRFYYSFLCRSDAPLRRGTTVVVVDATATTRVSVVFLFTCSAVVASYHWGSTQLTVLSVACTRF